MPTCPDADAAKAALADAINGPAEVTTDAGTVKQHDLSKLIEAAEKASANCAAKSSPTLGLRMRRMIPPGAV